MNRDIWFTADHHLGHKNIDKWTNRVFASIEEHDQKIIDAHNNLVNQKDTVYVLGDFSFHNDKDHVKKLAYAMNGRWVFIKGNHDKRILKQIPERFAEVYDYHEIKHNSQRIVLSHYPLLEWNRSFRNSWMLHGHSHGSHPDSQWKRMDVGVDTNDMKPWSFEQIQQIMKDRKPQSRLIYEQPTSQHRKT